MTPQWFCVDTQSPAPHHTQFSHMFVFSLCLLSAVYCALYGTLLSTEHAYTFCSNVPAKAQVWTSCDKNKQSVKF